MKVEIPELKRCCFCLPLRYGLIAWGYIKLVLSLLLFSCAMLSLIEAILHSRFAGIGDLMIISFFLMVLFTDICLTVVFIVGGHRKSANLLRVHYIYNIVILCLYTIFFTWVSACEVVNIVRYRDSMSREYIAFTAYYVQVKLLVGIAYLGLQVYIIILTRSEVNKLRNSSKYRFCNPTLETEQSLDNGTNEQGPICPIKGSSENGTDSQFEGIINETKKADSGNFNYNKF